MPIHTYASPIGKLTILQDGECITRLYFENQDIPPHEVCATSLLCDAEKQLREYFAGKLKVFDLPFAEQGTTFNQKVWAALTAIEYGKTSTYKDIAASVGSPKGARAVGNACNRNPLAIFVPCHRVLGTSGKLTGFAGGLDVKQFLLDLEQGV